MLSSDMISNEFDAVCFFFCVRSDFNSENERWRKNANLLSDSISNSRQKKNPIKQKKNNNKKTNGRREFEDINKLLNPSLDSCVHIFFIEKHLCERAKNVKHILQNDFI